MTFRRYFCRKQCFHKILHFFTIIAILHIIRITILVASLNDSDRLIEDSNLPTGRSIIQQRNMYRPQCPQYSGAASADIYTYDLPDITSYEFVSGKKFKEYAIPVKDESVAYGPNLDPLEVFVIPFSHVDPGYGMTLAQYYHGKSKSTLTNMVKKLDQYTDLTFQWAETIFLERWWRDISDDVKNRVRALIQDGRLEILSGGWVMPDEAITHYYPVIDQLIEGHQWLWENLNVKPKNNWANDPFGYSSTFSYLWKKAGMENMVILRMHQAIKGTLMKKQALEFIWKPLWSNNTSNDIFCHIMPYRGYWIGDTCGPYNQHICREYAFMHTDPVDKVVFVTEQNLKERARILYEQYRITAEIYRRDNLNANNKPVPQNLYLPIFLGEDFSYVTEQDFDLIYENYMKLFKYMNSKTEWNIKLKFGTVAEYFTKVKTNQEKRTLEDGSRFSKLAGDFLPYSDYQNDYWTGYYSTRPFIKQLSRELQSTLKMADIFHSYAHALAHSNDIVYDSLSEVTSLLRDVRRDLGMFLHHDGITGTSVSPVIRDFQMKIFVALSKVQRAVKLINSQLLTRGNIPGSDAFKETTERISMFAIPRDKIMNFTNGGSLLTVMNPSARKRMDVVSFVAQINDKYLVTISGQESVKFQRKAVNDSVHRISVAVNLPPFSIKTFRIEAVETSVDRHSTIIHNTDFKPLENNQSKSGDKLFLENVFLYVEIDTESGFPKKIRLKNDATDIDILTQVLMYTSLRSGPYIFAPDGCAKPSLFNKPKIVINKGFLVSEIRSIYSNFTLITTLYNVTGIKGMGVHITTEFDMSKYRMNFNKELVLRFQTSVNNGNIFYTDQNSFQLIGRKTRADRLIEENYYPITSMMIIEDQKRRLTLHTAQPHGAACLRNGWMEVMLDRRVNSDDGKGLGQGVMDNILTIANFVLQLEIKNLNENEPQEFRYTFPSELNLLMNELLNEPTYTLFVEKSSIFRDYHLDAEHLEFTIFRESLPCRVSVVGMRCLTKSDFTYDGTSLVLLYTPTLYGLKESSFCENREDFVTLQALYPNLRVKHAKETSLTHLYDISEVHVREDIRPTDMELRSFNITF